ncbi:MAG TPA: tetratricopeptide repeat protein [Candidatus Polarisedimenticolia bacterium]|nr:tetratricopeptide repeat protein [Candidatus Polarisedimenticolia bacterium]
MSRKPLHLALLLLLTFGTAIAAPKETESVKPAAAAEKPPADDPTGLSLWKDTTFQKQFMGSYGALADYEPKLSPVERTELEKVLALMAVNQDSAISQLQAFITPESSALFDFILGNLYFQKDNSEEAVKHYRIATNKFPSFRRAFKNLGLTSVRLQRYDDAIKALSRLVELGGADGLSFGLLGYSLSATGQFVSAESAYRNAVLLQPDALDWKLGLAQSVLKQRKFGEVVSLCDELLAKYPDRADFWLLQANAWLGQDQPMKAAENFEIVARIGKATFQTWYTLGDIYTNAGLYDLAANAYKQAIVAKPDQELDRPLRSVEILAQRDAVPQARELLAQVRESSGGILDDAGKKRVLRLDARLAMAEGGAAGAVDGSGEAAAVKSLEEIVALDPLDGEALMLLGQHYTKAKEIDRAIFYYERASSLEPFEADAKVRQAQLLVTQNKYREAVPLLKRAQELKPRDEVARYLDQVERISRSH